MTDTYWTTKTAAAKDTKPVSSAVHTGYDAAEKTEAPPPLSPSPAHPPSHPPFHPG